jgi:hypothetical protein
VNPESEDSLVRLTELTSAGEDAAAVDPDREVESVAVFEREGLGGELGRTIE